MLPITQLIKKNWVYFLFVFAVALFTVSRFTGNAQQHNGEVLVSLKTFQTDLGWGYDVYLNDSVYIHQAYIPAAEGRKGFAAEKEALQIGELVIDKMKHNKLPVITLQELDSCGIKR